MLIYSGVVSSTHAEVSGDECTEDASHGVVIEWCDADQDEVTQEPRRDHVTTAARWRHRTQEMCVLEYHLRRVLQIIPTLKCTTHTHSFTLSLHAPKSISLLIIFSGRLLTRTLRLFLQIS